MVRVKKQNINYGINGSGQVESVVDKYSLGIVTTRSTHARPVTVAMETNTR